MNGLLTLILIIILIILFDWRLDKMDLGCVNFTYFGNYILDIVF